MAAARRDTWSWILYDWANSAFATTVMAGFFPLFLKQYWSEGADPTESTLRLGTGNAIAGILVAVLSPVLGVIADRGGTKKPFLLMFTALGIVATAALAFLGKGEWQLAVSIYVTATVGFTAAIVFYDAMLVDVAEPRYYDRISGAGFAAGYLGGGILFAVNVLMTLQPQMFGLADAAEAVRLSFLTVAVWWGVFSIPLFASVHERREARPTTLATAARESWRQLATTFAEVRRLRPVFLFLFAYWFYIDGVNTVIKMAVDYGLALGFPASSLITALLLVQFVGFPAAVAFGRIGERWGTRRGIYLGISVYLAVTVWACFLDSEIEFFLIAIAIGLVQGGVQSLSRSFYARLIPAERSGEFFGFYGMIGRFATIVGPLLMGWVGVVTGSPRLSILSLVLLFAVGLVLLRAVDERNND